jgi:sulfite oxidase
MRRRELLAKGGLSAIGALLGRPVLGAAAEQSHRESFLVRSRRPENFETPIEWFDRLLTPNRVFFVRSHFGPPRLDLARRLRVEGLVGRPFELDLQALEAMPQVTLTAVLQCAGNGRALHEPRVPGVQWVHGAMGQAEWTGVRLRDLLGRAGVAPEAAHVELRGADVPPMPSVPSFHRSIPIARAMDPTTLVALRMNGEPLGLAHGAPMRLVVPGWAGDHWFKWLTTIRAQREETPGFYMQTGYRYPRHPVEPGAAVAPEEMEPLTTFPIKSVIARPADGGRQPRGAQEIVGIAFSGEAAIDRVEVSLDHGASWKRAALEGAGGAGRWQVFRFGFDAGPGRMRAVARAVDARGTAQPERAAWNPSGYFWNGWHAVEWEVV